MLPFIRLLEIGIEISCYTTTQNNPSVTNQDDSELLVPESSIESGDAATRLSLHKVHAARSTKVNRGGAADGEWNRLRTKLSVTGV